MKPYRYPGFTASSACSSPSSQRRNIRQTAAQSQCLRPEVGVLYTCRFICLVTFLVCGLLGSSVYAQFPGQNVNMVSGTQWPYGDPFLERQDEPSLAVSTRNPLHLLAGANDYRTVDLNLPEIGPGDSQLSNAPTGEPWVGQYMSIDGGARWQSTLLPGYPQDTSARGMSSPLHGFTTAADPVVASGTNGMFYYAGIAFNRGTSLGLVFVSRFIDLNNKENGNIAQDSFPIRYINTVPVSYGSNFPAQFLDKPWLAVDIPRSSSTCSFNVTQADGSVVTQKIPAGNVYVAYANVATTSAGQTSTIYFSRSTNCGAAWSSPIAISRGYALSQGATIQIDPETGIVYVAWRVIHSATQPNDGIAIAASIDGGRSFFPPITLVSLPPFNFNNPTAPALFDQNTTATSFRTTAYPALAVADSGIPFIPGPLYLSWSQRGMGPNGEARIMMLAIPGNASFSSGHFIPPTPFPVDNGAITNDVGGTFPALTAGHQVMPAMTFNQGKLMLLYYDLRQDHSIGEFAPNVLNGLFAPDAMGNFFEESRDQVTESPTTGYSPYFIDDAGLTVRRHTLDLVLAQSNGGFIPKFNYARVTHYDFGLFEGEAGGETAPFHQLKFDPPNLPMFMQGKGAFMGDYLGISGQPFVLVKCGSSLCWTYNNPSPPGVAGQPWAAPKPAPTSAVHFATWTSNQDVIPPLDGRWDTYTAIASGTSVYDNTQTVPTCQRGNEGDRNQNVYSSRISQGLLISSPQVSKPLSASIQRGFVVLVQNQTSGRASASGPVNYFRMTIANQPVNGFASFAQFVPPSPVPSPPFPTKNNGVPFPMASIDVAIAPHTGIARTLFAVSSSATASILVNVQEITGLGGALIPGGLTGFLLLNADGTVPSGLVDPNGQTGSNSISNVELYDPNVSAPNVSAPNVSAPNVSAPNVSAPNVSAPNVSAPNVSAPNVSAPNVSAYGVANPNVSAPNVSAPNVSAAPPSDGTFAVTNTGNTTAAYQLALTGSTPTPLQLLLSQVYMTPQTDGQCHLITQQQNITLANLPNAPFTSVNQLGNPNVSAAPVSDTTFSLQPGDTAYITIRGNVDIPTMQQIVTQVTPAVVPLAINSNNTTATTSPTVFPPLSILTAFLPPTDRLDPGYSIQLIATGGKPGVQTWSIIGGALPPGINLSPSGLISGQGTTPGSYPVTIQVVDGNSPPASASQSYVLNVSVTPLSVQFTMPPGDGIVGQPYTATPLVVTGGTTPYTWTATGLPPGLSISATTGQITGIPTTPNPGGSSVMVTATDSATPPESIPNTSTIRIGAVIQISPSSLPGGTIGVPYTAQLTAMGGIGTLVFGPPSLPGGGTLSSSGLISFTNPQASSVSISVSVHDQANPNQFQTANYTINFAGSNVGHLSFVTQPSNTVINQVIAPAVRVLAVDNTSAVLPGVSITLSLLTGPGTLSGTLTQLTDATGVATFNNLSINAVASGDVLQAAAGSTTATSTAFNITSPPLGCNFTPAPPLSWYPFDGNALDIRGGKPGTVVGDTGGENPFVPAKIGQGFKPTGEGVGITVPNAPALNPVNFSVGAWIRVDGFTADPTMLVVWQGDSSGTDVTTPWAFGVESASTFVGSPGATQIGTPGTGKVFGIFSDGTNELDIFSNTTLVAGQFYYVTLTWGGPHVGASLYVNGNLENSGAVAGMGLLAPPIYPFQIGGVANGSRDYFDGAIDELQIWGNVLRQFQISTIYNAGANGQCQSIWFTESNGSTNDIGVIATDGTHATEYTPTTANGFPFTIAAGPDGNIWFTENSSNKVGVFTFLGGGAGFGEYQIDPVNTAGIYGLANGPDGNLWFTESQSPQDISFVGTITTGGTVNLHGVGSGLNLHGIAAGPDGNLWFTESAGSNGIGRITPGGTTTVTHYTIPTAHSFPESITTGPDGNLWFTENATNKIGVISASGIFLNEFAIPAGLSGVSPSGGGSGSGYNPGDVVTVVQSGASGGTLSVDSVGVDGIVNGVSVITMGVGYSVATGVSTSGGSGSGLQVDLSTVSNNLGPWGIAVGSDGNVWFTARNGNNIVQVTPAGMFTSFPLPPTGGSPEYITAGSDGNLWYTDFFNNAIGRITPAGVIAEFPTPTVNSGPWGIALGPAVLQVPAPPTNVSGSNPFGQPVVTWTASSSPNVSGYNVYRATSAGGPLTLVGSNIQSTNFTDPNAPGICGGTNYYYVVTAIGPGSAESTFSNETSAVTVFGSC